MTYTFEKEGIQGEEAPGLPADGPVTRGCRPLRLLRAHEVCSPGGRAMEGPCPSGKRGQRRAPVRRLVVHQARRLGPGDGRGGPLFGVPLPEPGDAPRQGLRLRPTSRRAVY